MRSRTTQRSSASARTPAPEAFQKDNAGWDRL